MSKLWSDLFKKEKECKQKCKLLTTKQLVSHVIQSIFI